MARGSGTRRPGGGLGSRVVAERPLGKTAKPTAHAINVRAVSQIGQNLGNHATDHRGLLRGGVEKLDAGRGYSTPVGPTNSLNTGPHGQGREVRRSGTQGVQGPVNPGLPNPGANKPIFPGFK